jgi:hypothetical protein
MSTTINQSYFIESLLWILARDMGSDYVLPWSRRIRGVIKINGYIIPKIRAV